MSTILLATGLCLTTAVAAHAQNPLDLPVAIGEGGSAGVFQQTSSPSTSFLFNTPGTGKSTTPSTYGFSEEFGGQSDQQIALSGLALNGSAYFTAGSAGSARANQPKEAINQNLSYRKSGLSFNIGYLDIDKQFSVDNSLLASSVAATAASLKDLLGKTGQSGLNTGLGYDDHGNKFGLTFSSIADALKNEQKTSSGLSLEHDFDKAFSLGFITSGVTTTPSNGGLSAHLTTDILHLAYSPTRSGFLLDSTSTRTLTDQGDTTNDLLLKVAQHFQSFNLSSQFESSQTASSSSSPAHWQSEKLALGSSVSSGVKFSTTWNEKSIQGAPGVDDFDATIKAAETRYVEIAAEYAKNDDTPGQAADKETFTARITPGITGPLGMLSYNLAISNQQVQLLDGLQTASASVQGMIRPINSFDFISGAKFYLAYTADSSSTPGLKRFSHTARTLRIANEPAGRNGLSWSVSQQQRLDQNGQPLRTASDYEIKFAVTPRLSIALTQVAELVNPDGTFANEDQRELDLAWKQSPDSKFVAQYIHIRSMPDDISGEDGYYLNFAGPFLQAKNVGLGIGGARKVDPTGADAIGTSANVSYGFTTGSNDLVNVSSKLTDWQNHGFDGDDSPSVEEAGQLNFQKTF